MHPSSSTSVLRNPSGTIYGIHMASADVDHHRRGIARLRAHLRLPTDRSDFSRTDASRPQPSRTMFATDRGTRKLYHTDGRRNVRYVCLMARAGDPQDGDVSGIQQELVGPWSQDGVVSSSWSDGGLLVAAWRDDSLIAEMTEFFASVREGRIAVWACTACRPILPSHGLVLVNVDASGDELREMLARNADTSRLHDFSSVRTPPERVLPPRMKRLA